MVRYSPTQDHRPRAPRPLESSEELPMTLTPNPSRRDLFAAGAAAVTALAAGSSPGFADTTKSRTHLPQGKPEDVGLDPKQLQIACDLLEKWTTGPKAPIPSGAILVGRNGKTVEPRFFGRQGPEPDASPIRRDGLFLMASISKPITYLGAMLLVERGQLGLSDLVTRYIPEFAAHGKQDTLVSQLFTHTSGLPDMLPNNLA